MTLQSALTATVNHFMREQKLSEVDVAAQCSLDISTIRRITRGTGNSTPETALKLAMGIGVSAERFYAVFNEYQARPPVLKVID